MTDPDDRRSQSGYVFLLNGGAVSWRSWKQSTTADSTTVAEVMAAAEASKEEVWIKKFLEELGVVSSSEGPLELFCDNSASISQIKEPAWAAWVFGPCIAAIPSLRPIFTIDAYFLPGRYHGKLLMACMYDAENQLFPIEFGLVEKEGFETWGWFMK